jgi:hypothetical protein
MPGLSFSALRESIEMVSKETDEYSVTTVIDEEDAYFTTFANPKLYAIVSISAVPGRCLIDVHAGGAYGVSHTPEVLELLATSSWRFDYGGLWCRTYSEGTTTPTPGTLNFGWRSRLPSELFSEGNRSDAFGFLFGMVEMFGAASSTLAEAVAPIGGGRPIRVDDPQAWPALLGGMLPPEDPGN